MPVVAGDDLDGDAEPLELPHRGLDALFQRIEEQQEALEHHAGFVVAIVARLGGGALGGETEDAISLIAFGLVVLPQLFPPHGVERLRPGPCGDAVAALDHGIERTLGDDEVRLTGPHRLQ